jgi:hypothetical protein
MRESMSSHHRWIPLAALAALVLVIHANSLGAGFALDGKGLVLQDPRIRAATAANVALVLDHTYWWPYGESGLYRPVTTLSYLVDFAVLGHGENARGYHATNLLLHVFNALLLYTLARRLSEDGRIAWFTAAVWAVHPVLTESVANVAGRADLLAAGAVLTGVLCYDNGRLAVGGRRRAWLIGLAISALVGLLSKENAIVIVGAIGLLELARWQGARSRRHLARGAGALAVPLLIVFVQRWAVLSAAGPAPIPFTDNPIASSTFLTGRLTALAAMGRYLWLLAWPSSLSADYSYAAVPLASGSRADWLAWFTLAVAVTLAVVASLRSRTVFFWSLLALGAFLPTSNLVITIGSIMAERFLYLPSAGIVACVVLGVFAAVRRVGFGARTPIVLGLIMALLSLRSVARNADWRDDVRLATATVRAVPNSAKAHRMLAGALFDARQGRGEIDDVIAEAGRAIAIVDSLPDAINDGELYLQAGGYLVEKGERLRREGTADPGPTAGPSDRDSYQQAIPLLQRAVAIGEAQKAALSAERFAPHFARVYSFMSTAYLRLGDSTAARDAAGRARMIAPLDVEPHERLTAVLLAAGRFEEAAVALTTGLMLTSSDRVGRLLVDLYRTGLDTEGCAILGTGPRATINPQCALVRRHVCAATDEALALLEGTASPADLGERLRATAVGRFGCRPGNVDGAARH